MGSPSAIELAESNRNLDFLEHSLVREYIRIVWLGMAFEKCFATERRRDPDYNPYLMPNFYGKSSFGNKKDNSEFRCALWRERFPPSQAAPRHATPRRAAPLDSIRRQIPPRRPP